MSLTADDRRHGTSGGYTNHGCRCALCTEAIRLWHQNYRWRHGTTPRPAPGTNVTHGRISTYNNGCRCDSCREASARKRRAIRRRQGAQPKPAAQKYPEIPEIPEARWQRHAHLTVAALIEYTGTVTRLCERTGADPRTIARAAADGLTIEQADRYAIALGLHPAIVWPAWLEVLAA